MDDIISLVIVFAIYLIAASNSKKKKKNTSSKNRRREKRMNRKEHAQQQGFEAAFEPVIAHAGAIDVSSCDQRPMHLHEVSQERLSHAGEGEDPCHVGGHERMPDTRLDEAQEETLPQNVLRGVIMSEILMRPHERAAIRRSRR